jgi:hypothetical protein
MVAVVLPPVHPLPTPTAAQAPATVPAQTTFATSPPITPPITPPPPAAPAPGGRSCTGLFGWVARTLRYGCMTVAPSAPATAAV